MTIAVVLAALPGFLGCSAYTAHTPHPQVRPAQIVEACADANFVFTRLRWTRWDAHGAAARGVAHVNDCTPYCAAGHFHDYAAHVTLSAPRSCHGRREFTRLAWSFDARRPKGMPRRGSLTYRCA